MADILAQLEEELNSSHNVSVKNQQLYYTVEDKQYIIERYQTMIRKRRTSGGHQPMLTSITEFQLLEKEHTISFYVHFENGEDGYAIWTKRSIENVVGDLFYFLCCFYFFYVRFIDGSIRKLSLVNRSEYANKNYYIAKIMKQMALSEQSIYLLRSRKGFFTTTTGSVTYQWVQQSLFLEVEVSPFIFRSIEEVK